MKRLFVTCDDCGLSEGINHASAALYEKGLISAASVMTNFPAADHALALFSHYPELDVGVHLNLTDGFPLSPVGASTALTDRTGRFHNRPTFFTYALLARPIFLELVETELTAQIQRLIDAGVTPHHLTTHIHFHGLPSLKPIIDELAQRFEIAWIRNNSLKAAVVPLNIFLRDRPPSDNASQPDTCTVPDYLVGLQYWMRYSNPEKLLAKLLTLNGTIEMIVHPCLAHDETYPPDVRYPPHERFEEMQFFETFYQLYLTETATRFDYGQR